MDTPYEVVHLVTAASTQDEARARRTGGPLLVFADEQTAGRGRSGARWEQADRAVAASLALTPQWPVAAWPRLMLAAGLAARDAIARQPGSPAVGLKWPNDLMVDGAKVGGLISESDGRSVVIGMGVNLWWRHPIPGAAALWDEDPGPRIAGRIAESWAAETLAVVAADPDDWPRRRFASHCVTLGCRISWDSGEGLAVGIAGDGGLEVDVGGTVVVIRSGAVRRIRWGNRPAGTERGPASS